MKKMNIDKHNTQILSDLFGVIGKYKVPEVCAGLSILLIETLTSLGYDKEKFLETMKGAYENYERD